MKAMEDVALFLIDRQGYLREGEEAVCVCVWIRTELMFGLQLGIKRRAASTWAKFRRAMAWIGIAFFSVAMACSYEICSCVVVGV